MEQRIFTTVKESRVSGIKSLAILPASWVKIGKRYKIVHDDNTVIIEPDGPYLARRQGRYAAFLVDWPGKIKYLAVKDGAVIRLERMDK